MKLNKVYWCKNDQKHFKLLGRTPPFLLEKNNLKIWIFIAFFTSNRPFGGKMMQWLSENIKLNKAERCQIDQKHFKLLRCTPPFLLLKNYGKSFFTSNRPFGGYFQWKTPISRKYVAEKGIVMPNWPKTFQTFSFRSSIFVLEKQPKIINFERVEFYNYLSLVATFSERRTPTSEIYVVEQDILMPNWSKTFQTFRSHSSVFATEKLRKSLNFQRFFT